MTTLEYTHVVNTELFQEELDTALRDRLVFVAYNARDAYVRIIGAAGIDPVDHSATIEATLAAHDPQALTARQAAFAAATDAPDRAKAIPGWALWDEQQAIDYINETVTDLDSAKTVLVAMARLLVAQRDALWPGLGVE